MEPFRIGDVTIERVVPKTAKVEEVATKKRVLEDADKDEDEGVSVNKDLKIFLRGSEKKNKDFLESSKTLKELRQQIEVLHETESDEQMLTDGEESEFSDSDSDNEKLSNLKSRTLASADKPKESEQNPIENAESLTETKASDVVDSLQRTDDISNDVTPTTDPKVDKDVAEEAIVEKEAVVKEEEDSGDKNEDDGDDEEEDRGEERSKRKGEDESGDGSPSESSKLKKKKRKKRKKSGDSEGSREPTSSNGSASSANDSGDSGDESGDKKSSAAERKLSNMRRNIREVMSENQLDEETLAAQRREMERLRRVQDQQKILREVQRQMALNKQNTKTQTRVISLLTGNSSLTKLPALSTSAAGCSVHGAAARLPNTVLVKLQQGAGQAAGQQAGKKVFELLRVQKSGSTILSRGVAPRPGMTRTLLQKPRAGVHMMTPSVSIAPVVKPPQPLLPRERDEPTDSDEDEDDEDRMAREALRKVAGKPKTKGKGKNVVTISSSSEDDCILLSEPSSSDEADPVDDPTNSGMHTNDAYNVADEQGRVLVNVGHPPEEADIFLAPQIARIIKPHQIGGVRFLFDNVVESVDRFESSTGFGCILAHSMGLGKTLQVVSFCDVFLRHTPGRTVLCILPINTLQNWLAEFNMWLPDKDPASPAGETRVRDFSLHVLNDSHKSIGARAKVIREWHKDGGVLLIGYELYRQFSLKRSHRVKKRPRHKPAEPEVEDDDKTKEMLDDILSALVKPGPDLVICDEGHRIKNSHASISQALKQIRSKRRIVLTGYPLQNNLLEYWCMVDFVRPNYLGTKTEFCNMFERPIQNGQCYDSTPQDVRLMRYRAHVLHSLLEGFVQRRSQQVLQLSLPQKEEYVLLLRMMPFQRKLYDVFMNEVVRTKAVPNPLKAFAVCCKIWNHPDVLYNFLKKRAGGEAVDLDLEEATAATAAFTPPAAVAGRGAGKRGRGRGARGAGATRRDRKTPFPPSDPTKPAASIPPNSSLPSASPTTPLPSMSQLPNNPHSNYNYPNNPSSNPNFDYSNSNSSSQFSSSFNTPNSYNPDSSSYGFQGSQGSYPECGEGTGGYGNAAGNNYPYSSNGSGFGYNFDGNSTQSGSGYWGNQGYYQGAQDQGGANYQGGSGANFPTTGGATGNYQSNPATQSGGSYTQNSGTSGYPSGSSGFPANAAPATQTSDTYPGGFQASGAGNQYYDGGNTGFGNNFFPGHPSYPGYGASGMEGRDPYSMGPYQKSDSQNLSQNSSQNPMMGAQNSMMGNQNNSAQSSMMGAQNSAQNSMMGAQNSAQNSMLGAQNSAQNSMMGSQNSSQNSMVGSQNTSNSMLGSQSSNQSTHMSSQNTSQSSMIGSQNPMNSQNSGQSAIINALNSTQSSQNLMMNNPSGQSSTNPQNRNLMLQNHSSRGPMSNVQPFGMDATNPFSNPIGTFPSQDGGNQPGFPQLSGGSFSSDDLDSKFADTSNIKIENLLGMDCDGGFQGASQGFEMKDSNLNPWASDSFDAKTKTKDDKEDFGEEKPKVDTDLQKSPLDLLKDEFDKKPDPPAAEPDAKPVPATGSPDTDKEKAKDEESGKETEIVKEAKEEVKDLESLLKDTDCANKETAKEGEAKEEPPKLLNDGKHPSDFPPGSGKNGGREDPGIPYDWAVELLKNYIPGNIENSAKMDVFFLILTESMSLGDRMLVFSQSLFTLNLIEDFLQSNLVPGKEERWARNVNYYRLDGSTTALEREKLINEYNVNPGIHLFLVSTRAGSLGINLVGANRVIVFDASWNPCHDTQAVCRVYRYGQQKPCFVYRLVMDNCLEKKIYDRQINKQGMADRVVDECNPDAHLSIKEVTNLCWDDELDSAIQDFSKDAEDKYDDIVMQKLVQRHSKHLSKEPFQHESLLVDRKEKKLSQAEKRLAQRSYELEKQANINYNRPHYPTNTVGGTQPGLQIRAIRPDGTVGVLGKPVASVRPMQSEVGVERGPGGSIRSAVGAGGRTRWIPAEVWQRQGMSAQEMTLPLDVVIPTNSADRASIVLKAGQRVMVLKSPKGIYMQLENGKIIAIRTAFKVGGAGKGASAQDIKADQKGTSFLNTDKDDLKKGNISITRTKVGSVLPLKNNSAITIIPKNAASTVARGIIPTKLVKPDVKPWARPGAARQRMLGKMLETKPPQEETVTKTVEDKSLADETSKLADDATPTPTETPDTASPADPSSDPRPPLSVSNPSSDPCPPLGTSNASDEARPSDELDGDSELSSDNSKFQSDVEKLQANVDRILPDSKAFPDKQEKRFPVEGRKFQMERTFQKSGLVPTNMGQWRQSGAFPGPPQVANMPQTGYPGRPGFPVGEFNRATGLIEQRNQNPGMQSEARSGMQIPETRTGMVIPEQRTGMQIPEPRTGMVMPEQRTGMQIPEQRTSMVMPEQRTGMQIPEQRPGMQIPDPRSGLQIPDPRSGLQIPDPRSGLQIPDPRSGLQIPDPRSGMQIPDTRTGMQIPDTRTGMVMPEQRTGMHASEQRMGMPNLMLDHRTGMGDQRMGLMPDQRSGMLDQRTGMPPDTRTNIPDRRTSLQNERAGMQDMRTGMHGIPDHRTAMLDQRSGLTESESPTLPVESSDDEKRPEVPTAKSSLKNYRHNFTHAYKQQAEPAPRAPINYTPNLAPRSNKKPRSAPKSSSKSAPVNYQAFGEESPVKPPEQAPRFPVDPAGLYPGFLQAPGYGYPGFPGYGYGNGQYPAQQEYPPQQMIPPSFPEKVPEPDKSQEGNRIQDMADKTPDVGDKKDESSPGSSRSNSARSTPGAATQVDPNYPAFPPAYPPYDMMYPAANPFNRPPANPYPAPPGYPMGYPEPDYARASMYSAFHRPEPHHFPGGELASPFNPNPHFRNPMFPNPPAPQPPNYYPQNMYPGAYGARPGYPTDPAYSYGAAPGFNPFMSPHLAQSMAHQGYPGIPGAPTQAPQNTGMPPQ